VRATSGRPRLAFQATGRRLGGIHMRIPRRPPAPRNARLSYPRSATNVASLWRSRPHRGGPVRRARRPAVARAPHRVAHAHPLCGLHGRPP
jgi:hypothetical protein